MNIQQKAIELEKRLLNWTRDYEDNPNLSDAQKEKAWNDLHAEMEALDREAEKQSIGKAFLAKMGNNPAGLGAAPNTEGMYQLGAKGLGKDLYPFALPKNELKQAYE